MRVGITDLDCIGEGHHDRFAVKLFRGRASLGGRYIVENDRTIPANVPNALQGFSQNRDKPVQIDAASREVRDEDKVATFVDNDWRGRHLRHESRYGDWSGRGDIRPETKTAYRQIHARSRVQKQVERVARKRR